MSESRSLRKYDYLLLESCGVCSKNGGEENAYRVLVGKPERLFSLKTYEVDGEIN